ncbi:MAG: TlpA family protein disulfide reductase [Polyangiaceae bacterium]|nr:TlpA family protein disulfide reductase [Polyangiaceae bacterium]
MRGLPLFFTKLYRYAKVDRTLARNYAIQIGFIALAAAAVFGFVQAARKDQMRALCSATCAMRPTYAGRNRTAPDFKLPDIDGKMVSLSEFKGKTVVMNFWSYTCEPCMKEMPALARLAVALEGRKDIVFITVNNDDFEEQQTLQDELRTTLAADPNLDADVSKVLKEGRFPFRILRDPTSSVTKDLYGTTMVPETWIIDGNGFIRARYDGMREWDSGSARRALEAVSQGPGCLADFAESKATGRFRELCDAE